MKKSAELELDEVEAHVLGCPDCLDRVLELESFVQACRDAFPPSERNSHWWRRRLRRGVWLSRFSLTIPKWSWAPALAALVVGVALLPNLHQPQQTFDATLSAARGVESGPCCHLRIPMRLHLDAIDLAAGL